MTKMLEIGIFSLMLACLCKTNGIAGSSLLSFLAGRTQGRLPYRPLQNRFNHRPA